MISHFGYDTMPNATIPTTRPNSAMPPGPRGTLILGMLGKLRASRLDFYLQLAQEYGDLVSFRIAHRRVYLASHPDLIEQVLVTDARHYIKHFGARLYKPVLGNGLVTSEGDFWLRQRKLSQPAFLKSRIQAYVPVMAELTDRAVSRWSDGQQVDIHEQFSELTSAIALKTLFDLDDPGDRETFVHALRNVFTDLTGRLFSSGGLLPLWVPTPANRRIQRGIRHLYSVVDGYIARGRTRSTPGTDLLSRLIAARDDDGQPMTDRQLREEAMTLYLAGHETTALTLTWAWYLLAQHPQVEEKLLAEWSAVLGGRTPGIDDLTKLPYTDAVLTEAMRVYPPVYLVGREALCDLELGGYRVPKGTTIFMSQWVSHRDPRYFSDPEEFRPERWLDGLAQRIPRYAYYPFGGGPRVCIGQAFALMEAAILLAGVGQQYRFTIDPGPPVEMDPQITLLPKGGIPVTLKRR